MGPGGDRRRRHRAGRGAGRGGARPVGGAAGKRGLRQGHLVARDQAGARRRALPGAGRHRPGARGAARAQHAAGQRAAGGAAPGLRGAGLQAVRAALLRRRPEGLRRAGRPPQPGADRGAVGAAHAGAAAHGAAAGAGRRHQVLGRPVRRCAAGAAAGAHRHRARRRGAEPLSPSPACCARTARSAACTRATPKAARPSRCARAASSMPPACGWTRCATWTATPARRRSRRWSRPARACTWWWTVPSCPARMR